ncbi:MAG: TIGR00730 family Rossman fold protein [Saprospiraceae bacterium]
MNSIKKVTVYCSSSNRIDQAYFDMTKTLAEEFVKHNITGVFGGGGAGLMGHLADNMIKNGGHIIGIMPHFMKEAELQHPKVTEFVFTETMRERKHLLINDADALVTLPGGCGTFEELFEALTLKRLGRFTKPIIIVNTNDYYAPMIEMLNRSIEQHFMGTIHGDMWTVVNSAEEVIDAIKNAPKWTSGHFKKAVMK